LHEGGWGIGWAVMSTRTESAADVNAIVRSLETLLADSYALMGQTHLAHWNVEGTDFFQLHEGFQGQYEELFEAVDQIAEHIRSLDAYPPGGLKMLAELSEITEMDRRAPARDFVAHLVEGHEILISNGKEGRKLAGEAGDAETEDLFIERLRAHQKTLWMLKSHLK